MIYKIAAVGFALFIAAVCYTCSVVASMADDENERMMRDAWIDQNKNQNDQTDSGDTPDASANQK
jgi:hypothetical protein